MFSTLYLLNAILLALRVNAELVRRDLHIQNANLSPDGFTRSYVFKPILHTYLKKSYEKCHLSTVTADAQIPGPLISGNIGDQFLVCEVLIDVISPIDECL